jgi:hypothetical protein
MAFSTKYTKNSPDFKRFNYQDESEDIPIAVSVDGEYEDGEGYNISEYEIRWYCYQCDSLLSVNDSGMLLMKNFDVIEDENTGEPVVIEKVVVAPPNKRTTKDKKKGKGITTAEDTQAADIDVTYNNSIEDHTIAYCNHCNAYIIPEEKDKLRSLVIRKDNDKVVDVQRQYYGYDEETNDVLVADAPDVLDAFYEGRQPKLTGVWEQMFGKGSTKRLLDYTETYPASNKSRRYTGNQTGQLTNNDVGYNTQEYNSTKYAKDERPITFREEKSNTTRTNKTKTKTNSVNRSPYPTHSNKKTTEDPMSSHKRYMADLKRRGKISE